VEIDARTQLVGLIGWPVAHSLSPRMHNAAFEALGLNFAYVPLPVPPEQAENALRGLVALGFAGANVTVPHKRTVRQWLDEVSPAAEAIGAVNTLVVRSDGTLLGDNTDAYGFMTDLAESGWAPMLGGPCRALVIGAGGAARAVVYGLLEGGAEVAVVNRSLERADDLCQAIGAALRANDPATAARLSAHPFPRGLRDLAERADLIVNATTLGLHGSNDPLPWDPSIPFHEGQLVYDLVPLAPRAGPTSLLALAAAAGARVTGGLGMLLHQGAKAFELWTGVKAPIAVMRDALK
jgi:shikimate dehydrogenase